MTKEGPGPPAWHADSGPVTCQQTRGLRGHALPAVGSPSVLGGLWGGVRHTFSFGLERRFPGWCWGLSAPGAYWVVVTLCQPWAPGDARRCPETRRAPRSVGAGLLETRAGPGGAGLWLLPAGGGAASGERKWPPPPAQATGDRPQLSWPWGLDGGPSVGAARRLQEGALMASGAGGL